jgi:Peptidase family M1 domain
MYHRFFLIALAFVISTAALAQTPQPPTPETPPASTPQGTVLFNRTEDAPPQPEKEKKPNAASAKMIDSVTDADRASITFTAYDLDVHIVPAKSHIAVRAGFTIRNTGTQPLTHLALQLSSALNWENLSQRVNGSLQPLPFGQHLIDTDTDHTGQAQEAIATLSQPLAPGATLELSALYSGDITHSGQRLERIGAPPSQAYEADWDAISSDFTALRGFGNVLWYPTASAPTLLGDGAKLFQLIGQTKLRQSPATIHLRLSIEYLGEPPHTVWFCGQPQSLIAVSENVNAPVADSPGVATADFPTSRLGFRTPSLFVTATAPTVLSENLLSAVTAHDDAIPAFTNAAEKVQPLLVDWLGPAPITPLYLIDHDGQPFEDNAFLVAPMRSTDAASLTPLLSHSLTHAWFVSVHPWLNEGVAQFMSLLWIEQSQGRDAAVDQLQDKLNTLALTEPDLSKSEPEATPTHAGQSLLEAHDEIYYRTKAAAVLWMLRSITSDDALKQTLQLYRHSAKREDPNEFQRLLEQTSKQDLHWFFDDWVNNDRGLPDLNIVSVTPRQMPAQANKDASWLIAVEVRNDGNAVADVPVIVRSGTLTASGRLRIPGRSTASTRIVFEGTPTEVIVNDGTIPEQTASTHTRQLATH